MNPVRTCISFKTIIVKYFIANRGLHLTIIKYKLLTGAVMDIKQKIGKRIKELRKSKRLSQEKLSELADIAQNSLSNIETGDNFFTAETLEKIADALDIEPLELFNFGHFKSNEKMLEEINKLLKEHPEKIPEFYRIVKAIIV